MSICLNEGSVKITQKVCLVALSIYLYTVFSLEVKTCPLNKVGWHIYPFDKQFFHSSVMFLMGAAIILVECNIWPNNTKPENRIIQFLTELYIMTMCIILVYVLFWHPIVIATSVATDKLGKVTHKWLGSSNIHLKSIPICMVNIRSTKFICMLLSMLVLHYALNKFGKKDL